MFFESAPNIHLIKSMGEAAEISCLSIQTNCNNDNNNQNSLYLPSLAVKRSEKQRRKGKI